MKLLFIHVNFPCQFSNFIEKLLDKNEIKVLTFAQGDSWLYQNRVEVFRYPRQNVKIEEYRKVFPKNAHLTHKLLQDIENSLYVSNILEKIKTIYYPNVIICHDIYFDSFLVKNIFPSTKLINRMDLYHNCNIGNASLKIDIRHDYGHSLNNYQIQSKIKNITQVNSIINADAVYCATQFEADTFPEKIRHLIKVIFDGIDTRNIRPGRPYCNLPDNIRQLAKIDYILYTTRSLEPIRGFCQLIRSIPLVINHFPNIKFIIIGNSRTATYGYNPEGNSTWKEKMLREVSIPEQNLIWYESLPQDQLFYLMNHSKLHLYLTYPWVLSWSLFEAMSMKCNIIASDVEPVREVIEHQKHGYLVNIHEINSISNGIIYGLEHLSEMQVYANNARERVVSKYDKEINCKQFINFLEDNIK